MEEKKSNKDIQTQTITTNTFGVAVFLIFIGSIVLRFFLVAKNSFWLDEITSLEVAKHSLRDILECNGFNCHTPPFYYLLLHFWLKLMPATEFGLRSLSVLLDSINSILVIMLAARMFDKRVGLYAGVLYATSSFCIYFAQEARMYPLLTLLVLLTCLAATNLVANSGHKHKKSVESDESNQDTDYSVDDSPDLLASDPLAITLSITRLALLFTAGIYTHYYYFIALAGITFALCAEATYRKNPKLVTPWIVGLAVAAISYLPWLSTVLQLLESGEQEFRRFPALILPYGLFRFFAGYGIMPLSFGLKENLAQTALQGAPWIIVYGLVVAGSFGMSFLLFLRRMTPLKPEYIIFLVSSIIVPLALIAVASLVSDFASERYFNFILPLLLIVLSAWLATSIAPSRFGRNVNIGLKKAFVAVWSFALCAHFFNPNTGFADWRGAIRHLDSITAENRPSLLLVNPNYTSGIVKYYLNSPAYNREASGVRILPIFSPGNSLAIDINRQLELLGDPQLFLLESVNPNSIEQQIINSGLVVKSRELFKKENGIIVVEFERKGK